MTEDQQVIVRDARGDFHRIYTLTRGIARERAAELLWIHNLIPNQHWELRDLLAEHDETRVYHGKWEISSIALTTDKVVSGFCIGFEREPDFKFYFEKGIYLHRLSVSLGLQGRAIGALLQTETIVRCFLRGLTHVGGPFDPVVVYGQTDSATYNRSVHLFHKAAGFEVVGEKPYERRTDVIMRMTAQSFWASRHVAMWRQRRLGSSLITKTDSTL